MKEGRRDSMTDPEGDVIYYDYDSVKLIRIKRNTDEEAYFAYDAGGRRNYTVLGNNSYTYYDYDINGRLKRVANHKSDESVISSFEYTLDPVGNRTSMKLASGDTVYYEYDGIYQLVKEDRRESDDSLVYTNYFEYDLAGNRTHLHYVDGEADEWTYYTYNIENQLTIEEKGGVATYYTYDPAGALLSKKTGEDESTYDYTYEGLMKEFTHGEDISTYKFDTDSRRVEKDIDGTLTKYEYNGFDVVAEYDVDDVLQATFNTSSLYRNLTVKRGGTVYFYIQDALGSIRNILDVDEVIKNVYDYNAFGSNHGSPTETILNPFKYTGQQWDSESNLYYYRFRMYPPIIGRFTSKDPMGFRAGTNHYLYTGNNPLNYSDYLGLRKCIFNREERSRKEFVGYYAETWLEYGYGFPGFTCGIDWVRIYCVYKQGVAEVYDCDEEPCEDYNLWYQWYDWTSYEDSDFNQIVVSYVVAITFVGYGSLKLLDVQCKGWDGNEKKRIPGKCIDHMGSSSPLIVVGEPGKNPAP